MKSKANTENQNLKEPKIETKRKKYHLRARIHNLI